MKYILACAVFLLAGCANPYQAQQDYQAKTKAQCISYQNAGMYPAANACWSRLVDSQNRMAAIQQRYDSQPVYYTNTPLELPKYNCTACIDVPAPTPIPPARLAQSYYDREPPKTWGETPYAPMIAPVMRGEPITNVNPLIPPVAR